MPRDRRGGAAQPAGIHAVVQNRRYRRECPPHPAVSRTPARSARRPASTAISSSRRTSAAFARRCVTCCCSTWRSTHSTPPRYMVERRAAAASIASEWEPAEFLVSAGLVRRRDLRDERRRRVHLPRQLVRRRLPHELGSAAGASSASAARSIWDGFDALRAEASTGDARRPLRQGRAGRQCRRSIRATGSAAISASSQDFVARRRERRRAGDRAAPTTSRAWRWSSARSRAPRPAGASTITI